MRGTIQRRGESSWRVEIDLGRDATGRRRRVRETVHGSRDDAELAKARMLLEVGQGRHVPADDMTLGDALLRYLARAERDLSPSTYRDYHSAAHRHIIDSAVGATMLRRITPQALDDFYIERGETLGPDRVRRLHQVISNTFTMAVRYRWVGHNVTLDADPPSASAPHIKSPSPDEVKRLVLAARAGDVDLWCYLVLAYSTGARRGELVALRWASIDDTARELVIDRAAVDAGNRRIVVKDPKTYASKRRIALGAAELEALEMLRNLRTEQYGEPGPDDWVFRGVETMWRPDTASYRFRKLRTQLGLDHVRPHQLRHFMATQLLAAGHDVKTVAGRGGWSRASTVLDRYASWVPANDRAAADAMGAALDGKTTKRTTRKRRKPRTRQRR